VRRVKTCSRPLRQYEALGTAACEPGPARERRSTLVSPVAGLSHKIAAQFRAALKAKAPAVFADIPSGVWQRE
jgi:hypothetical protein